MATRLELLDRDALSRHRFRIGDALVAQRIELAGDDESRWQAGDLAAQRRDARIGAVGRRAVEGPEPVHQGAREEVAGRIVVVGGTIEAAVGDRAYQELAGNLGSAPVARELAG